MVAEVKSKNELLTIAGELKNVSAQFTSETADIISNLSNAEDYDGIPISQAAMTIQNNLKKISGDMESLASSINIYAADINTLDTYNLQANPTQINAGDGGSINDASLGTEATLLGSYNPNSGSNNGGNQGIVGGNPNSGHNTGANQGVGNGNPKPSHNSGANQGIGGGNPKPSHNTGNNQEVVGDSKNELRAEGKVEITQGDPNYDLKDRYHQYVESIFQMTSGNLAYKIGENDFDLLCAIVSAEGDKSYDGSLAVVSTILNRCEHPDYMALYGADPIAQATAYNQFYGYSDNRYKQYTNGRYSESVMQAVTDALAGVRNHKICNFSKDNMITL